MISNKPLGSQAQCDDIKHSEHVAYFLTVQDLQLATVFITTILYSKIKILLI